MGRSGEGGAASTTDDAVRSHSRSVPLCLWPCCLYLRLSLVVSLSTRQSDRLPDSLSFDCLLQELR